MEMNYFVWKVHLLLFEMEPGLGDTAVCVYQVRSDFSECLEAVVPFINFNCLSNYSICFFFQINSVL